MASLFEKITEPDTDTPTGPILWTVTVIWQLYMLLGHIFLLFAITILFAPILFMILLMLVDGIFGTHLFEAFDAFISPR